MPLLQKSPANYLVCLLVMATIFTVGCASGSIEIAANVEAEALQISPTDGSPRTIGNLPQRIKLQVGSDAIFLRHPGYQSVQIIIPSTSQVDGKITVDMKPGIAKSSEESQRDDRLLDRLLAAHRSFLRGQIKQAKSELTEIENDAGGAFYGLLMLRANIAYLEKDYRGAKLDYARARALLPKE